MIKIGTPWIEEDNEYAILKNKVTIDGNEDVIWFKVDKQFKEYLCTERDDAYLIVTLNYAMRNHHDIELEAPITETLLYNIETYLCDALSSYNSHFYRPVIKADASAEKLSCAGAVATGISVA